MSDEAFVSYAQNAEDVVLWRALHDVNHGRYVEVGANAPTVDSISRAFYDRGWRGIAIEPVPALAQAFRDERPRDTVVEAAITSADTPDVILHMIDGTGLSTIDDVVGAGHSAKGRVLQDIRVPARRLDDVLDEHLEPGSDVHFLVLDTEGAERLVLESVDLTRWQPWVLVIEATAPESNRRTHESWEPLVLKAGYEFCLFDGLSNFYVSGAQADRLRAALSYPACVLDDPWMTYGTLQMKERLAALEARHATEMVDRVTLVNEVIRWRGKVLEQWSAAAAGAVGSPGAGGHPGHEAARLRQELQALKQTLSWRVTKPLRTVRREQLRRSRRP